MHTITFEEVKTESIWHIYYNLYDYHCGVICSEAMPPPEETEKSLFSSPNTDQLLQEEATESTRFVSVWCGTCSLRDPKTPPES